MKLENKIKKLQAENLKLKNYKKAFEILSCYTDSISDEEIGKVNKKLEKLKL